MYLVRNLVRSRDVVISFSYSAESFICFVLCGLFVLEAWLCVEVIDGRGWSWDWPVLGSIPGLCLYELESDCVFRCIVCMQSCCLIVVYLIVKPLLHVHVLWLFVFVVSFVSVCMNSLSG